MVQAALGLEERVVREAVIKPGTGVAGWVAQHRRPVCVSDISSSLILTMPRSATFTMPHLVNRMLSGLMSR